MARGFRLQAPLPRWRRRAENFASADPVEDKESFFTGLFVRDSLVCLSGILPHKTPLDKAETRLVKEYMEVTRKSFLFPQFLLNSLSCGHSLNSICEKELYQDAEHTRLYYNTILW
ncbi:hypothetical protein TIFTF001_050836 [Ficus carica]|uniref:Uncharacterized protein n=1 Tax=Ficus carica TaxID=3494 RepID=A0AA87YNP0_FICCA|nr:hypothetical protein TIFTF001_050836 [Ficus carica]